jgi:hypothetical protein
MALLIVVLNVGLLSEASHIRLPVLSLAGALLSWVLLGVWWFTVAVPVMILPALVVMAGFAVLTLGGNTWARAQAESAKGVNDDALAGFDNSLIAGLVGHLFIAFVVTRPELSVPPWPVFGVLAALQLAVLGASLVTRRGGLHLVASMATAVILLLWTTTARVTPWPTIAVYAAGVTAVIAFAAMPLARRVGAPVQEFELAAGFTVLLGQVVALFAQIQPGAPSLVLLGVAQVVFIAAALSLSWIDVDRLGWFAVAAVVPAMTAGGVWQGRHDQPADWVSQVAFAAPMYLTFIVHPLLLGRRARGARSPFVATVLASFIFLFIARHALRLGGFGGVIGALPLVQALLLAPVLAQLVKLERERLTATERGEATIATDRLVLVAAAVLGFVTLAIPLQLEKNWITIAWALEGAALLWLCRRLPHIGLLAAAVGLLATAFVRLTLNPAVLAYHPRGAMPILNWYLYTYLTCATAMFVAARLARSNDAVPARLENTRLVAGLAAAGTVLLFLLLNIEIADFYSTGPTITFNFNASLAQDLTYTLGWAAFAVALLAAGITLGNRVTRVASIILLAVTVLKCFVHDLGRLGGLYRVGSFVGLAFCLALVALALQKFVLARAEPQPDAAQP